MVAATVTQDMAGFFNMPGQEVVVLEASDAETYESRKFSVIIGGGLALNTDADINVHATFSGKTATCRISSGTDRACTLTLYGRK